MPLWGAVRRAAQTADWEMLSAVIDGVSCLYQVFISSTGDHARRTNRRFHRRPGCYLYFPQQYCFSKM